nr:unnamed protein product [Callosobruchus analis]
MTFGRNTYGQLGLDNTETKTTPTLVPALEKMNVIGAACGRNHTLFLTDTGTVYACGDNRSGQCGFSVILDVKGGLHSFGLPEYGQLGHNTDGKYFKTSTKLCFNYQTSPKRIVLYIEKTKDGHVAPVDVQQIVDFSCGQNHTVAIDSKKRAFSWGFGGFGRLGHAEQKDEMYFDSQSRGVRSVHCGSTYSLAITEYNGLFMFGQTRKTGEANMYPKPIHDLAGWVIKYVGTAQTSIVVAADETVISWGGSPCYGELGYGEIQKSSTVTKLSGYKALGLSMGLCFTLMIVANDTDEQKEKVAKLPEYKPAV